MFDTDAPRMSLTRTVGMSFNRLPYSNLDFFLQKSNPKFQKSLRVFFLPSFVCLIEKNPVNAIIQKRKERSERCNEVLPETPQGFRLWKTCDMKNMKYQLVFLGGFLQ